MNEKKQIQPTERELEILQILWEKGSATVREIFEDLKDLRNSGYTTTLKTMQIMTEKGLLERDTSSRTHVYTALQSRKKTQKHLINKMINELFSGSVSHMVLATMDNRKLTRHEIKIIKKYLKKN